MYPWESDPETGVDHTPHFAYEVYREIHVNADIAIAQWQYYLATDDKAWLQAIRLARDQRDRASSGSAASPTTRTRTATRSITSPRPTRPTTMCRTIRSPMRRARKALEIAVKAAAIVGEKADPKWSEVAAKMYIPFERSQAAPPRLRRERAARQDHLDGFVARLADVSESRLADVAAGAQERFRVPAQRTQGSRRRPERDDDGHARRRCRRNRRREVPRASGSSATWSASSRRRSTCAPKPRRTTPATSSRPRPASCRASSTASAACASTTRACTKPMHRRCRRNGNR